MVDHDGLMEVLVSSVRLVIVNVHNRRGVIAQIMENSPHPHGPHPWAQCIITVEVISQKDWCS